MGKIYVTSDLHFGHKNIIRFENRPFESVEEMDDALINNWNKVVSNEDLVYILGDLSFYRPANTMDILRELNGKKILIIGNHDLFLDFSEFDKSLFEEIIPYKEIKYKKKRIIMSHYPIAVWNGKHYGTIHLFGHIHSNIYTDHPLEKIEPNSYNVGVDMNHYKPVLLDDILELIHKSHHPEEFIPKNPCYCDGCPFWDRRENVGSQNFGYCHYLREGDFEINKRTNNNDNGCWSNGLEEPMEGTTAELFWEQFPHSLLWDGCKECGINDDWDEENLDEGDEYNEEI